MEFALLSPWIILLFIAIFDFGFYAFAAITTANAARVAALYTASNPGAASDVAGACTQAIEEMRALPNVGSTTQCVGCAVGSPCTAGPLQITAQSIIGAGCADYDPAAADPVQCTQVTLQYQSVPLIPLPWMMGQMNLTRVVQARVEPE